MKQQISVFQRQTIELENITLASNKIAQVIAKDKRPLTDGDFVQKCMMAVVEAVCSEKIILFSDVSYLARTITRRIREIFDNVKYNQKDYFEDLQFFSIAIDESTDTAQLAVFVSGGDGDFHVVENFVQLFLMMGTNTGTNILKALLQCLEAMNLNLSKLVSTTTDRAPSIVRKI